MSNALDDCGLIADFFAALELRDLERCQAILAQAQAWCAYLEGILVNERDRDWARAERIFDSLLLTELDPSLRGRVLLALGRTYEYQGRWAEAIHAYERSLPVFAELDRPVDQAKAWKQIAISHFQGFTLGDFGPQAVQQALTHCRSALDALESIADPPRDVDWLKGSIWNALGLIHRSLGQWDEAIACYQRDLAICRRWDDRFGMGLSFGNLGEVYQERGRESWPQALAHYQQALSLIREFDDRYQEIEALANLGFLHQEMQRYEPALEYYAQAIDLIESLRAGVSAEEARAGFFATVVDTYANTVLLCLETGDHGRAFDLVERARARAFLDVLAAGSPNLPREMEARTMTLAEVQAALPGDALLIAYFASGLVEAREGRVVSGPVPQRRRFPPSRTLILAVTHDGIQVHDAGISPNDLLPHRLDSAVERHFLEPRVRRTLYARLIAPVDALLQGRRLLYLVPHGPLHYIPFQALLAADGETLLREDGPQLVYAPSATILFRHGLEKPDRAPETCLALGYDGQGANRLRFAEEEARSIARLTGGKALVGPSPKKDALCRQAGDCQVLHLACHGEFDPQNPMASALCLAPGEALTARDVLEHLHLRCDLVTLSACESGLSRVRRGDELMGLIRAFMHAGAPAVVCTLWRVDERSTRILMERFYREIQAGAPLAQALKRAQLDLQRLTRREALDLLSRFVQDSQDSVETSLDDERLFADPYYWAPFVLVGDHGSGALRGG